MHRLFITTQGRKGSHTVRTMSQTLVEGRRSSDFAWTQPEEWEFPEGTDNNWRLSFSELHRETLHDRCRMCCRERRLRMNF